MASKRERERESEREREGGPQTYSPFSNDLHSHAQGEVSPTLLLKPGSCRTLTFKRMEEDDDDDDWSHLLSNCETGLQPVGFDSVDDVAMQSSCDENGLGFPNDRLSEGSEIPLAGSSLSGDECLEFSSESGSKLGSQESQDGIEFEEVAQPDSCQDEVMPDAKPYPGVDMQPWFNKRKPLDEQGQGLLVNVFCFFAKLPRGLRRAIGKAIGAARRGAIGSLAKQCCGLTNLSTATRIFTAVQRNNWVPSSKVKRLGGCRRRIATQTEEAPGRGKILIQRRGFWRALP